MGKTTKLSKLFPRMVKQGNLLKSRFEGKAVGGEALVYLFQG